MYGGSLKKLLIKDDPLQQYVESDADEQMIIFIPYVYMLGGNNAGMMHNYIYPIYLLSASRAV
jgi:hypothetical protein